MEPELCTEMPEMRRRERQVEQPRLNQISLKECDAVSS